MLLGGILMVKAGVSDHQQVPPSYPFAVLSKDAGLAWNRCWIRSFYYVTPCKDLYTNKYSLELNMLALRNFTISVSNVGLAANPHHLQAYSDIIR